MLPPEAPAVHRFHVEADAVPDDGARELRARLLRERCAAELGGTLDLYAPRLGGATAGDIAIDAGAPLQILGARAITLSAVQRYDDAPVAAA